MALLLITSAVADTRKPFSLSMAYALLPEYPVKARVEPELLGFWLKQTWTEAWSTS